VTHPAGNDVGVGRAAVWYGVEVEGKHALGAPTAFIDRWPMESDLIDLLGRLRWREVTHVFLTENFVDFASFAEEILPCCLSERAKVTIATMPDRVLGLLNLSWVAAASLMVRATMDAGWVRRLRAGDQVTVGVPYDLVTWTVEDGVITVPADYLGDKRC